MEKKNFTDLMERVSKKWETTECWYNDMEEINGDQFISQIVANNYFTEMIEFAVAAMDDKSGILDQIIEKNMTFPCMIRVNGGYMLMTKWEDVYESIEESKGGD